MSSRQAKERALLSLRSLGRAIEERTGSRIVRSGLRRLFKYASSTLTVNDFDGNLTVRLYLNEHMQRRIFWMGYYNLQLIQFMKKRLSSGMVFMDVGANIGELTLVASKLVGSEGSVIAFEPVDFIAEQLEFNLQENSIRNAHVFRKALSDEVAKATIHLPDPKTVRGEFNQGLASILGTPSGASIAQTVEVVTLDDLAGELSLTRLDLIKVDIEGAESRFLKGAEGTLQRFSPDLILEFNPTEDPTEDRDVMKTLGSLGYRPHRIDAVGSVSALSQWPPRTHTNVLWTRGMKKVECSHR